MELAEHTMLLRTYQSPRTAQRGAGLPALIPVAALLISIEPLKARGACFVLVPETCLSGWLSTYLATGFLVPYDVDMSSTPSLVD